MDNLVYINNDDKYEHLNVSFWVDETGYIEIEELKADWHRHTFTLTPPQMREVGELLIRAAAKHGCK